MLLFFRKEGLAFFLSNNTRLIRFVICGPEHSGTTLVSDLFRQVPGIDAGFEVGVLLAPSPRSFPELAVHAEITRWGWGVDAAALDACCDTDDFAQFYDRLHAASTVLKPGTHTIFDKTPRYLSRLADCMGKLPVPFLVVFKDPRALVCSDWRKAGAPPFSPWFEAYAPNKLDYLRTSYASYRAAVDTADPRVCPIRLETLCLDTRRTCERVYAVAGCTFDPAYMVLAGVRYENTRQGSICAGIPFEYTARFSKSEQAVIATTFVELNDWFYA